MITRSDNARVQGQLGRARMQERYADEALLKAWEKKQQADATLRSLGANPLRPAQALLDKIDALSQTLKGDK